MNPSTEYVVLVDDAGRPIGSAPKATVHHAQTPLHLAFSVFLFDDQGRVLFQQRAPHKPTWPGVWSNTCCGHPLPGEALPTAVRRRLAFELGIPHTAHLDLTLALPDFRYRARWADLWENELCPVFVGHYTGPLAPNPAEVAAVRWIDWTAFATDCLGASAPASSAFTRFSPWSRWEAAALLTQQPDLLAKLTTAPHFA